MTIPLGRWTPVRAGNRYCSPACGGNCTYAGYLAARARARRLARACGPRWVPRVTESLGWHAFASIPDATRPGESLAEVRGGRSDRYTAQYGSTFMIARGATPGWAIVRLAQLLQCELNRLARARRAIL